MAQEFQQRVLLVDADLRRPSIHRLFGIAETPGLTDVLMGGGSVDDALVDVPDHRLTILPVGRHPDAPGGAARIGGDAPRARHAAHAASIASSSTCRRWRRSPTCAIASSMADGILMIVRAGVTPKPAIERALVRPRHVARCWGWSSTTRATPARRTATARDGYVAG